VSDLVSRDGRLLVQPVDGPAVNGRQLAAGCVLSLAFFIDVMGSTSVFAAGPAIASSIGLGTTGLQWAFIAATLPAGALLLVGGRLADRYGRRRMFILGLAILMLASVACGHAGSAGMLVAARAVQGVAGALVMPASLALLLTVFTSARQRAAALATWSAVGGVGATAGLLFGGLVAQGLGWPWVFWINVPVIGVLLAVSPLVIRKPQQERPSGKVDLIGATAITLALGCCIYGLTEGAATGWLTVRSSIMFGLALMFGFVFRRVERRSPHPMIPPGLIRSGTVLQGNLVLFTAGMCVDGLLFTLTGTPKDPSATPRSSSPCSPPS
jgi:MFS family permease